MKVILNADDFGFSNSVNKGIVECYLDGRITSTTLMMNTPYTDQAIKLAKENNIKNIGIHLNLTYGKSVLPREDIPSLVDEKGVFHYVCMLGYYTQYVDAKKELRAQIEKFLKSGLKPTHLDYHHYFHEIPNILKAYLELAKEYNLPVRSMSKEARKITRDMGLTTTDLFSFDFHNSGVSLETLQELHDRFANQDVSMEIMTTVGYIDEYTASQTGYLAREMEMSVLKEAEDIQLWDDVQKISFADLAK